MELALFEVPLVVKDVASSFDLLEMASAVINTVNHLPVIDGAVVAPDLSSSVELVVFVVAVDAGTILGGEHSFSCFLAVLESTFVS